jgi:hypothetical protein
MKTNDNVQKNGVSTTMLVAAATLGVALLSASGAMAGTDTTFDPATDQVEGWLEGSLGKLVTITSIGAAVLNIVTAFNWKFVAGALGVGVTAGLGPDIAGSFVTALF